MTMILCQTLMAKNRHYFHFIRYEILPNISSINIFSCFNSHYFCLLSDFFWHLNLTFYLHKYSILFMDL